MWSEWRLRVSKWWYCRWWLLCDCIVSINDSFGWEIYSTIAHGFVSFLSKERIRFLFCIVPTQCPQFHIHVRSVSVPFLENSFCNCVCVFFAFCLESVVMLRVLSRRLFFCSCRKRTFRFSQCFDSFVFFASFLACGAPVRRNESQMKFNLNGTGWNILQQIKIYRVLINFLERQQPQQRTKLLPRSLFFLSFNFL